MERNTIKDLRRTMTNNLFDFGMTRVARIWRGAAAAAWSWSIQFSDGRTFHVVRRTGNLKEWC